MKDMLTYLPNTSRRWERYREQLAFEYIDDEGVGTESCTLVAIVIGKLLRFDGLSPSVFTFTPENKENRPYAALTPKPYNGLYEWGAHHVAVADDHVFDPMLEVPEPIITYPMIAFGALTLDIERNDWMLDFRSSRESSPSR